MTAEDVERRAVQVDVGDAVAARAVDAEALAVAGVLLGAGELVRDEHLVLDRHRPVQVVDRRRDQRGRGPADPVDLRQVALGVGRAAPRDDLGQARARASASRPPPGPPRAPARTPALAARRAPPAAHPAELARDAGPRRPRPRRCAAVGRGQDAAEQERAQVVLGAPAGDAADRRLHRRRGPAGSSRAARRRRAPRRWRRGRSPSARSRGGGEVGGHQAAGPRLGVRALDQVLGVAASRRSGPSWSAGGGCRPRRRSARARRAAGPARPRAARGRGSGRPCPPGSRAARGTAPSCIVTWLKTPPPRWARPLRWKTSTAGHSAAAASIRMRPTTPMPIPPTPAR